MATAAEESLWIIVVAICQISLLNLNKKKPSSLCGIFFVGPQKKEDAGIIKSQAKMTLSMESGGELCSENQPQK